MNKRKRSDKTRSRPRRLDQTSWAVWPPTDRITEDRRASELAATLNTPMGREVHAAAAHDVMLRRIESCGILGAALPYVRAQWRDFEETGLKRFNDCLLIASDESDRTKWIHHRFPFPRALTKRANLPLDLMNRKISMYPSRLGLWVVWFLSSEGHLFPIAIASDGGLSMAGWVVTTQGDWWPIGAVESGLQHLFKEHQGECVHEESAVQALLSGWGVGGQEKIDIDSAPFQRAFSLTVRLQLRTLRASHGLAMRCDQTSFSPWWSEDRAK